MPETEGSLCAPSLTLLAQHERNLPVVAGVDSVDVADAGLVAAVLPLLALVVDHSLVHAHVCTTQHRPQRCVGLSPA